MAPPAAPINLPDDSVLEKKNSAPFSIPVAPSAPSPHRKKEEKISTPASPSQAPAAPRSSIEKGKNNSAFVIPGPHAMVKIPTPPYSNHVTVGTNKNPAPAPVSSLIQPAMNTTDKADEMLADITDGHVDDHDKKVISDNHILPVHSPHDHPEEVHNSHHAHYAPLAQADTLIKNDLPVVPQAPTANVSGSLLAPVEAIKPVLSNAPIPPAPLKTSSVPMNTAEMKKGESVDLARFAQPHQTKSNNEVLQELSDEKELPQTEQQLRMNENMQKLSSASDTSEEREAKKNLSEAYRTIFKNTPEKNETKRSGIIKTYAIAPDVSERQAQEKKEAQDKLVAKAKPFFQRVENYLAKAYGLGNADVISSAKAQLASLRERFPEYVNAHPDEITRLENMDATSIPQKGANGEPVHKDVVGRTHEELRLGAVVVKAGMKMTGDTDAFVVSRIQTNREGKDEIIFESEMTHEKYTIPAMALKKALYDESSDVDAFFGGFADTTN